MGNLKMVLFKYKEKNFRISDLLIAVSYVMAVQAQIGCIPPDSVTSGAGKVVLEDLQSISYCGVSYVDAEASFCLDTKMIALPSDKTYVPNSACSSSSSCAKTATGVTPTCFNIKVNGNSNGLPTVADCKAAFHGLPAPIDVLSPGPAPTPTMTSASSSPVPSPAGFPVVTHTDLVCTAPGGGLINVLLPDPAAYSSPNTTVVDPTTGYCYWNGLTPSSNLAKIGKGIMSQNAIPAGWSMADCHQVTCPSIPLHTSANGTYAPPSVMSTILTPAVKSNPPLAKHQTPLTGFVGFCTNGTTSYDTTYGCNADTDCKSGCTSCWLFKGSVSDTFGSQQTESPGCGTANVPKVTLYQTPPTGFVGFCTNNKSSYDTSYGCNSDTDCKGGCTSCWLFKGTVSDTFGSGQTESPSCGDSGAINTIFRVGSAGPHCTDGTHYDNSCGSNNDCKGACTKGCWADVSGQSYVKDCASGK